MAKLKRWEKIALIGSVSIIPITFIFGKIVFISSATATACPTYCSETKGSKYFHYKFTVNGEVVNAAQSIQEFKVKDFDSLKLYGCFKIKYSTIVPSYTRVIDKEIGNGTD